MSFFSGIFLNSPMNVHEYYLKIHGIKNGVFST